MIVNVVELGDRPLIWTKTRRYAPSAAGVFGEIFEGMSWADEALVVLDWENQWRAQRTDVDAPILPVMHVIVRRVMPDLPPPNFLDVTVRLDVNEVFTTDEITAETIRDVVQEMQEKMEEATARRLAD